MAKKRQAVFKPIKPSLPPAIIAAIESGDLEKVVEALMQLPPKEQQAVATYVQKKQMEVSPEHG